MEGSIPRDRGFGAAEGAGQVTEGRLPGWGFGRGFAEFAWYEAGFACFGGFGAEVA